MNEQATTTEEDTFNNDVIGVNEHGEPINSLGQTFAESQEYNDLCEYQDYLAGKGQSPWLPIYLLADKYAQNLLIASPDLVDPDFNPEGFSQAYFKDGEGWVAIKWDKHNDWRVKIVISEDRVTHFQEIEGPYPKESADRP